MKAAEVKARYIDFFVRNGHREILGTSLVPENDPSALFTIAGMHPLVPYLLGEEHPAGRRLVNCQKCVRTDDIDEVGDESHLTFFEMLGNWSLGDYFKDEAIRLSYQFLTEELQLDPGRIWVSVFGGNDVCARDEETAAIWQAVGTPIERIRFLGERENWWGPTGEVGPCGPCTEMFYDLSPADGAGIEDYEGGRFVEMWNDVFMEFNRTADRRFERLSRKNVDTGFGLERVTALLQGKRSCFDTELFSGPIGALTARACCMNTASMRIAADHLRAATFIISDGIGPSNVDQGYIVRRLIRRSVRHGRVLGIDGAFASEIAEIIIGDYEDQYPELRAAGDTIVAEIRREEERFAQTLRRGEMVFEKTLRRLEDTGESVISGQTAFHLYDTFGFPIEVTEELARERGLAVDSEAFTVAFLKHQDLSRKGAERRFKGGLADRSDETRKLHTATHLLHEALRRVLGKHVEQRGSNITAERLRFDFCHPVKVSDEEKIEVERTVNEQIQRGLPVKVEEMTLEEATARGAIGLFASKYGEEVKVYTVEDFSCEVCAGPHVQNTGELGRFKIKKEQAVSAGVRRIKAVLE